MLRERRPIDPEIKNTWRVAGSVGALGMEIAIAIALPSYVGYWLDKRYGTKWIMYIGLLIGVGAAIKALVRVTREYQRQERPKDDPRPRSD